MKMFLVKHVLFLIVIQKVAGDGIRVRVEQGWLEGELLDLVTGDGQYNSFKGIPYAQPPNGTLRFKVPQPPLSWAGLRNAKQHGSVCPQFDFLTNALIPGNEDCLFVNVYSPNLKPYKLLPVIVFIHGGGFKSGSGNVDSFGPDFLVRKDIVVVTLNYRLDALGFLSLGTKYVPGNAGLKDQVAALKWVQRNIKYFGGDANRVTLMGQSAGSACVGLHISSPMSKGLFQRAIALSGSPYCDWALPFHPIRRAFVLGKQLGFDTKDPDELFQLLQSVTSDKLVDTKPNILSFEEIYTNNVIKMSQFVPVVEKYCSKDNFLPYNIFEEFAHVNKVDILFGYTDQEVLFLIEFIVSTLIEQYAEYPELLVPRKLLNQLEPSRILKLSDIIREHYFGSKNIDVDPIKEFVNYANNASFVYDILRYYLKLPFVKNTVRYFYQFSVLSSRNVFGLLGEKYGISGAAHLDDLLYLFDPKSLNLTLNINSTEFQLIDQVTTIFTDFVKYGNPTYSYPNISSPLFDSETMQYLNIGNNLSVSSVKNDADFNFWNHLYSSTGTYISNDKKHI